MGEIKKTGLHSPLSYIVYSILLVLAAAVDGDELDVSALRKKKEKKGMMTIVRLL